MLDVVIVNWNSGLQLRDAVVSVFQHHADIVDQLIVVDNASVDESLSCAHVSTHDAPFSVRIICNGQNKGFGAACNQAIRHCSAEYVLFLNPDAKLLPGSLTDPFNYLKENSRFGICGIQLVDRDGRVARSCARFPSLYSYMMQILGLTRLRGLRDHGHLMTEWDHENTREVDHVIGAFYFVRRSLLEQLKGFDERFFVYLEDVDFSLRAHQAGWRTLYLASARAFHAGGGTSQQIAARRLFYSLKSRLLYGFRHFSSTKAWLLLVMTLLMEPMARLALGAVKGRTEDVKHALQAYGMLWRALPEILKRRTY